MYSRLQNIEPKQSQSVFLFGPRGTGKTQWLKERFPNAVYIDLLDFSVYRNLLANPNHLSHYIPPDYDGWIIIDEVQKIPELLDDLKLNDRLL